MADEGQGGEEEEDDGQSSCLLRRGSLEGGNGLDRELASLS